MRDIKITLSTDSKLRAPSAADEARRLLRDGKLAYPLPNRPIQSGPGAYVYFVRDGKVVGRALIDCFQSPGKAGPSFTGVRRPGGEPP